METIVEELQNIMPHGTTEVTAQGVINDMPQFIEAYLTKLKEAMVKRYPSKKEEIEAHYNFVQADNWNEQGWIEEIEKEEA